MYKKGGGECLAKLKIKSDKSFGQITFSTEGFLKDVLYMDLGNIALYLYPHSLRKSL